MSEFETYFDSAEGIDIPQRRAILEVRRHHCDPDAFLRECGDHETYNAQDVLRWLGY